MHIVSSFVSVFGGGSCFAICRLRIQDSHEGNYEQSNGTEASIPWILLKLEHAYFFDPPFIDH